MSEPGELCTTCHGTGETLRYYSEAYDLERGPCIMCGGSGFDVPTPRELSKSGHALQAAIDTVVNKTKLNKGR